MRTVAYKGSGKKGKIQGQVGGGQRRSQVQIGGPGADLQNMGGPKKSKGQDSRKVHDTKGKNKHGRTFR